MYFRPKPVEQTQVFAQASRAGVAFVCSFAFGGLCVRRLVARAFVFFVFVLHTFLRLGIVFVITG